MALSPVLQTAKAGHYIDGPMRKKNNGWARTVIGNQGYTHIPQGVLKQIPVSLKTRKTGILLIKKMQQLQILKLSRQKIKNII